MSSECRVVLDTGRPYLRGYAGLFLLGSALQSRILSSKDPSSSTSFEQQGLRLLDTVIKLFGNCWARCHDVRTRVTRNFLQKSGPSRCSCPEIDCLRANRRLPGYIRELVGLRDDSSCCRGHVPPYFILFVSTRKQIMEWVYSHSERSRNHPGPR